MAEPRGGSAGSGWAAMPARHFPRFAARGRAGGGFQIDVEPDNARHARHLAARDGRDEREAAQVLLQLQQQHGPSGGRFPAADVFELLAGASPCHPAGDNAAGLSAPHNVGLPINFHASRVAGHGTWWHDGTDFTSGAATQQRRPPRGGAAAIGAPAAAGSCSAPCSRAASPLPQQAPFPLPPRPASSLGRCGGHSHSAEASDSLATASALSIAASEDEEQQDPYHHLEHAAATTPRQDYSCQSQEYSGSSDCGGSRGFRRGWFTTASIEQLRLDRDRARSAEAAAGAGGRFVPSPGAKYPKRSARVAGGRQASGGGTGGGNSCSAGEAGRRADAGWPAAWAPRESPTCAAPITQRYTGALEHTVHALWQPTAEEAAATGKGSCDLEATARQAGAEHPAALAAMAAAQIAVFPASQPRRWWERDAALGQAAARALCGARGEALARAAGGGAPSRTLDALGASLRPSLPGPGCCGSGGASATAAEGLGPWPLPAELCHAAWVAELAARPLAERQLQIEAEALALALATGC